MDVAPLVNRGLAMNPYKPRGEIPATLSSPCMARPFWFQDLHLQLGHCTMSKSALATAVALVLTAGAVHPSTAAEIHLSGTGTFKPLSAEQLTRLPADLAFSRADLSSGQWSFVVRYEDRTFDTDPDPFVGRYAGAIRTFRLTVGSTTVEMPVDQAELSISDGGLGFPYRESIRLEAKSPAPYGTLRVGWVQLNQKSRSDDLRGAAGALAADSMPAPPTMASLAGASPFDRFLQLRIDRPGEPQPLLYLSSSKVSVAVDGATR